MFDLSQQFGSQYLTNFTDEELQNNLPFDPTDEDFQQLTTKQKRFVVAYSFKEMAGWTWEKVMQYVTKDNSAIAAHFSYSRNPKIQKFMEKIDYNEVARLGFSIARILEEEIAIAYSDITQFQDENGLFKVEKLKDLPGPVRRSIQSLQITELPNGVRKVKFSLWDKGGALGRMEKIKGMYAPEKVEMMGSVGVKSMDERAASTQGKLLAELKGSDYVDDDPA